MLRRLRGQPSAADGATSEKGTKNTELPITENNSNGSGEGTTTPRRVHKHDDGTGQSKLTPGIKAAGESGRRGIHPLHFFRIAWRSTSTLSRSVNILWPCVPAAIAVRYATDNHLASFVLAYLAIVPCANLIGFAGQEFARKFGHVFGVLIETTFGSAVEFIMFLVLLVNGHVEVVKAAILGSILATLLLCLGLCFFVGGMRRDEQTFSEVVSEAGSGLLLTAGFGLAVPTVFRFATLEPSGDTQLLIDNTLAVSRITSILLIIAYLLYVWYQARSHHSIYTAIFEMDEERDADGHLDAVKDKLTLTECVVALIVAIGLVALLATCLVEEIPFIVAEKGISDPFMGLILVPLVEKAAEHLSAIDEAWDDQMNFALSHVLGATLQTALFNGPFVVIVGWGMETIGHRTNIQMGLDFTLLNMVILILAILTVGNFLRDQKSNYLEGALCVITYAIIAVAAFYSPTLPEGEAAESSGETTGNETSPAEPTATVAARMLLHAAGQAAGL